MSGAFHSSPHRPGSGRRPSSSSRSTGNSAGPPYFQSLTRIANQDSERAGEEQRRRSMEGREGPWKRRWSGDKLRYEDSLGCSLHEQHPPFFIPSYLRKNPFAERLKAEWEAHLAELIEGKDESESRAPRKSAGSHRGVAQDVVERPPAGLLSGPHARGEDAGSKNKWLPSRWNEDDKWTGLDVVGDGSEVRFSGVCKTSDEAASIRTDYPIPIECGIYYFEITILSKCKEGLIGIGFSGRKTSLNRLPGWENDSWAYHGDDGFVFSQSANGKSYGPKFAALDVIGCGVNFRTGQAFFTRNGVHLGTAFHGLNAMELYPSVGIKKSGELVRANFGREKFVYDIDGMMADERKLVRQEINQADVSSLHPPDDENILIQRLVGQYLAHQGYVETSKAFAADMRDRAQALATPGAESSITESDDDVHAMNRQKIRKAILDGDIDRALKYTHSYYPQVLQDERNKDIYFNLRCRKFIEMMRRYSEQQAAGASESGSNGHAGDEEPLDNQMELDDQLNRESSTKQNNEEEDVDMEASTSSLPASKPTKASDQLGAALQYGQELQAEFGSDARPAVKEQLREVFAIMAYIDPRESVVGGLLDKRGRVSIAESVNGAILVSLGKPSSAALENLTAQTEAFLSAAASRSGGKASFVHAREDFLRPQRAGPSWLG